MGWLAPGCKVPDIDTSRVAVFGNTPKKAVEIADSAHGRRGDDSPPESVSEASNRLVLASLDHCGV